MSEKENSKAQIEQNLSHTHTPTSIQKRFQTALHVQ